MEAQVERQLDLEHLKAFLKALSEDELEIINALYFCNLDELSERRIARKLGIPQKTLNCAKKRILKKF